MKQIRTALLSFGMSGKVFHAPFIHQHSGFELYAVWERSKSESNAIYPNIKIVRSMDELLADESIDLIIVNTPTNTHFEYAKRALEEGKHVVVEKAFTTTSEEAIILRDLALKQNKLISVFQNRRWDSDFQTVKQVIDNGWLGTIIEAEFHFDRFKHSLSEKIHKEIPTLGAGLLSDLGPHLIDQALYLFGMPQQLFADIRTLRAGSLVDDYFDLLFYYPDLRVRLKSSLLVKEPIPSFIVHGQLGSFIKTRGDVQEAALIAGEVPSKENWGEEPRSAMGLLHTTINGIETRKEIPTIAGNYGAYYHEIYLALTGKGNIPVTAEDGIRVMQILEAARLSTKEGRAVKLNKD